MAFDNMQQLCNLLEDHCIGNDFGIVFSFASYILWYEFGTQNCLRCSQLLETFKQKVATLVTDEHMHNRIGATL